MEKNLKLNSLKSGMYADRYTYRREHNIFENYMNETKKIATSVQIMANEMTHVKEDVKDIKSSVEQYHTKEPNEIINKVKTAIATGVVGAIIGAILALILK
mgnify:CR=1 FL=1